MAINTKKKVVAAERKGPQSTTHFPNDETPQLEDTTSGYGLSDGALPQSDLLFDPEDEGGNAHFPNMGTPKDNAVVKSLASVKRKPQTAGVNSGAASRILASDEIGVAEFTQDVPNADDNATFGPSETGGAEANANSADDGPQATTYFPNGEMEGSDEEATRGYLTVGDLTELGPNSDTVGGDFGGEDGGDEEFEDDEEEVNASFEDEEETPDRGADLNEGNEAHQQSLLDVTDEHEVDAEFDDFAGEPEGEPNAIEDELAPVSANVDDMNLMDVDGMDDSCESGGFTTAAFGTMLHVVKAGRIIASMNKKVAVKAGHADMYLSDEFHEATVAECQSMGVRAGLKSMGFVLAKVNVARSDILNKRVEARAKQVTASIKRSTQASNDALGQCLAIAAVGINRQYFKDTRNELRAALEVELGAAGVRGASKLVRRVFASHGVDYAKAILTLANRLVGMPEDARNQFASALDMTSDGDFDADSDMEASEDGEGAEFEGDDFGGDEATPDFQAEAGGDFDEFEDDFEAEEPAPETIHAALATPRFRKQARVQASAANYSVQAAAILNGERGFGFTF